MHKEFVPYDTIRNNALKMAYRIYKDGFIPDIIYVSLRGGAYMGNVISEYFKFITGETNPVFYAAVVARSYTDVSTQEEVKIDGWTYSPDLFHGGEKVMLVDDVYDSGRTVNYLTEVFMRKGLPRANIKVVVHDYKVREYLPDTHPIHPDYWCRKIEVPTLEDETWIHYMSHELVGLSAAEAQKYYIDKDPELAEAMKLVTG